MSRSAAVIGLGRRGRFWAQSCLSAGWDVRAFDPAPHTFEGLLAVPGFRREETISGAVKTADLVFCCLPDRLELVQMVLQRVQAEVPPTAVLAVDSRLHDIEALQACAIRPGQIVRVGEPAGDGISLSVTDRNKADQRSLAEAAFAELVAVLSLADIDVGSVYGADAESA